MNQLTGHRPRALAFAYGLRWLLQSVSLVRRQPGRMLLIAIFMQLILGLTRLPLVGFLVILSVPGLTAGILEAFHVTAAGGRPDLKLLFRPLLSRDHAGGLLAMGALIFVVGVLSISVMLSGSPEMLDPDVIAQIEQGDVNAIAMLDQEALGRILLAFLVGISVTGTLSYFTIPLMWFGRRKLLHSLKAGLRALIVKWRPFLALALGLVAILVPLGVVTGILLGLAVSGGLISVFMTGLLLILLLAFQMILFGTQYCAYRDVFGLPDEASPPVDPEGQLLA